jgi:hypothetical protein
VGRPADTCQPGIVTSSQPWAEVSPVVPRGTRTAASSTVARTLAGRLMNDSAYGRT